MKVWTYVLEPEGGYEELGHAPGEPGTSFTSTVEMEPGAQVVEVTFSSKGVTIYALVEGTGVTETRAFIVCGNDVELPDAVGLLQHVGTAKIIGGPTAHVFDAAGVEVEA